MKVRIDPGVYNDAQWFAVLDVVALLIENRRHGLDAADLPELLASGWVAARPGDLRDVLKLSALARSTDSLADKSTAVIDVGAKSGGEVDFAANLTRIHPLDAVQFLVSPFHLIVENEWFDGAFVLWVAKAVGLNRLVAAYREGKFVFRHAGGKDAFDRCARILSQGVWPQAEGGAARAMRMRVGAMLDSDARHPNDAPNAGVIAKTLDHVSFVHQLRRRAIESYIPEFYLHKHNQSNEFKRKVSAVSRLTDLQKTYFKMKNGFKHDKDGSRTKASYMASPKIRAAERALFDSVSIADFHTLGLGFGDGLSEIFVNETPSSNDRYFNEPGDVAEIKSLCNAIYERL